MPTEAINPADHLDLVRKIACRYRGPGIDVDDLINQGVLGLMRAVELFDPSLGFKFSTYAVRWIKREIIPEWMNYHRAVPLSMAAINLVSDARKEARTGQADSKHATKRRRQTLDQAVRTFESSSCHDGEDSQLVARLDGGRERPPADEAVDRIYVAELLAHLTPRERQAIVAEYGLDGDAPRRSREIAPAMGISPNRARQLRIEGMEKIRVRLGVETKEETRRRGRRQARQEATPS